MEDVGQNQHLALWTSSRGVQSSSLLEGAVDTAPPGVVAIVSLLTVDGPTTSTAVHDAFVAGWNSSGTSKV